LATVTDEYIEYVSAMEEHSLTEITKFIALAATLILIKSKSLLPVLELTDEETEDIESLAERLKLYQLYRNAGLTLAKTFGNNLMYESAFNSGSNPIFVTDRFTTTESLSTALSGLINNLPEKKKLPQVEVKPVILLEEMIDRLLKRVEKQFTSTLSELTADSNERTTVIVGFLAVLEMVKQGRIEAEQTNRFADIKLKKDNS